MQTKKTNSLKTRDMVYIAMFAALMAACAWITVPMPEVPFTMQVFGVFLALCVLGGEKGTLSILVYILLGAVGAPVFSNFKGGPGVLLGVTGGYILGFLASGLVYWLVTALLPKRSLAVTVLGLCLGLAACYAFGTGWFMLVYLKKSGPIGLGYVLMKCVVPYILPDLCKMGLSVSVSAVIRKRIRISG